MSMTTRTYEGPGAPWSVPDNAQSVQQFTGRNIFRPPPCSAHVSRTTYRNFKEFSVHVSAVVAGSSSDHNASTLCTSAFVDHVIFAHNGTNVAESNSKTTSCLAEFAVYNCVDEMWEAALPPAIDGGKGGCCLLPKPTPIFRHSALAFYPMLTLCIQNGDLL